MTHSPPLQPQSVIPTHLKTSFETQTVQKLEKIEGHGSGGFGDGRGDGSHRGRRGRWEYNDGGHLEMCFQKKKSMISEVLERCHEYHVLDAKNMMLRGH